MSSCGLQSMGEMLECSSAPFAPLIHCAANQNRPTKNSVRWHADDTRTSICIACVEFDVISLSLLDIKGVTKCSPPLRATSVSLSTIVFKMASKFMSFAVILLLWIQESTWMYFIWRIKGRRVCKSYMCHRVCCHRVYVWIWSRAVPVSVSLSLLVSTFCAFALVKKKISSLSRNAIKINPSLFDYTFFSFLLCFFLFFVFID